MDKRGGKRPMDKRGGKRPLDPESNNILENPRSLSLSNSFSSLSISNLKSQPQSAMGKRGGRNPRLGSSPVKKPQLSREVGIVCHSMSDDDYEVTLYVVDVDQKPQPDIVNSPVATPAVRIIFPVRRCIHAVCVLNSTIYMFWGYHLFPQKPPDERTTCAMKFSLSNSNDVVMEKQLDRITPMDFPKARPRAMATPRGDKILVFSTEIVLKDTYGAFELYDPKSCTWETLPPLPSDGFRNCCRCDDPHYCKCFTRMKCFSFNTEMSFLIEYAAGTFIIDLEKKKSWKSLGTWIVPSKSKRAPLCNFVSAKEGLYGLTVEGKVYPLGRLSHGKTFHSPSVFPLYKFSKHNLPTIVGLGEDEQVCKTAILHIETARPSHARLLLDVFRTQLEDPLNSTSTTVSNTNARFANFFSLEVIRMKTDCGRPIVLEVWRRKP